jgi:hypothetical protein
MYRRQGYGTLLLDEIRSIAGQIGAIHTPVSPLGTAFFGALDITLPDSAIGQPDAKARRLRPFELDVRGRLYRSL